MTNQIERWKNRQQAEATPFSYSVDTSKQKEGSGSKNVYLKTDLDKKDISFQEQRTLFKATSAAISGSISPEYANMFFTQMLSSCFVPQDYAELANAINSVLLSMEPADAVEGQLCARLLVLNNHIAEYMRRAAMPDQSTAGIDMNINRATKLMRVYNETLDALNKHRRKGVQKVSVQYVNVNDGGQAVVTHELKRGGGSKKNQRSSSCQ